MKRVTLILAMAAILSIGYSQDKVNLSRDTVVKKEVVTKLAVTADSSVKELAVKDTTIANLHEQIKIVNKEARDKYLWGGVSPAMYVWGLFFAMIGIFINTYILTAKAIKRDPTTPQKFNWQYWWQNNRDRIMRWIGLLFVVFVSMRFANEIFSQELTMFFAFVLGLTLDRVIEVIKNLKIKTPTVN